MWLSFYTQKLAFHSRSSRSLVLAIILLSLQIFYPLFEIVWKDAPLIKWRNEETHRCLPQSLLIIAIINNYAHKHTNAHTCAHALILTYILYKIYMLYKIYIYIYVQLERSSAIFNVRTYVYMMYLFTIKKLIRNDLFMKMHFEVSKVGRDASNEPWCIGSSHKFFLSNRHLFCFHWITSFTLIYYVFVATIYDVLPSSWQFLNSLLVKRGWFGVEERLVLRKWISIPKVL